VGAEKKKKSVQGPLKVQGKRKTRHAGKRWQRSKGDGPKAQRTSDVSWTLGQEEAVQDKVWNRSWGGTKNGKKNINDQGPERKERIKKNRGKGQSEKKKQKNTRPEKERKRLYSLPALGNKRKTSKRANDRSRKTRRNRTSKTYLWHEG